MAEPPKMGIHVSPESQAQYERELQRDSRIIQSAVELASLRVHAELQAEAEMAAEAAATVAPGEHRVNARNVRSTGTVTAIAMHAAFVFFAEAGKASQFPTTRDGIAMALADKAEELGLTSADNRLDHESGSVRNVATIALKAAATIRARSSRRRAPAEKLPEVAGSCRAGPTKPA